MSWTEQTGLRAGVWPETPMKAVLEALPRPAFILDRQGIVRYANREAAAAFASTRLGDPLTLTFRAPEMAEALRQAVAGANAAAEYHPPGNTKSVYAVFLRPIAVGERGTGFVLALFEDASDRLAIARMRADFVANASHELRTPLASLTGFIETLQGPARQDPAASEKFLSIMLDQARRMRRLIDDLLSLSRAEMRVHRRPTDMVELNGVLAHVRDALAPLAAEQDVALDLSLPPEIVTVVGDRDELVQVFQNLVENALRYGASGKRVEVALDAETGNGAAVAVRDYGPGIGPEHLPRLTERFYRVDAGASRENKGTGLGLAIVKHILTRHQSELRIDSRLGEGATFTVVLPSARPARVEDNSSTDSAP
jgi:two-component system phosphate regulon sensor histidine kinase PhoR